VIVAGSGRETLERLDDHVAIVLLDVRLPDVDGLDLCDRIRLQSPHCRVIVMTAEWTPSWCAAPGPRCVRGPAETVQPGRHGPGGGHRPRLSPNPWVGFFPTDALRQGK